MSTPASLGDVFQKKYTEFCAALLETCPELKRKITVAAALSPVARVKRFKEEVLPSCGPTRDSEACPGTVLPGVVLPKALWADLSIGSQKAIQEYLTLLSFSLLMEENASASASGSASAAGQASPADAFTDGFMADIKAKMDKVDFAKLSSKIAEMFTATAAAATEGDVSGPKTPKPLYSFLACANINQYKTWVESISNLIGRITSTPRVVVFPIQDSEVDFSNLNSMKEINSERRERT